MKLISFETMQSNTFISRVCFEIWFLFCLVLGGIFATLNEGIASETAWGLFAGHQSLVMLAASVFLTLGFTYLAVNLKSRGMLLLIIFCRTSLFSYAAVTIGKAIPDAGWLIACLVLAGDWLCLITYHWFWSCCLGCGFKVKTAAYCVPAFILFVIFLCQYFVLYPFAESLFINL